MSIVAAVGVLPEGGQETRAWGVFDDGSTVVGFPNSAIGEEAFVWTSGGGMVSIGVGRASGITPDGLTVVGHDHTKAFRWTSGGMPGLGTSPPGGILKSQANGVSADGSVVVGDTRDGVLAVEAFTWDETNGMRSLQTVLTDLGVNLTSWTLLSAQDVSDDANVIVGYGTNPSGGKEAWVVDLVPEPASTLLRGAALIALATSARVRILNDSRWPRASPNGVVPSRKASGSADAVTTSARLAKETVIRASGL